MTTDPAAWAAAHGALVVAGQITLYKRVKFDLTSYARTPGVGPVTYTVGTTVTAPDWVDDNQLGHGLHALPYFPANQYLGDDDPPWWWRGPWPPTYRCVVLMADLADIRPVKSPSYPLAKAEAFYVDRELAQDGSEL